MLQMQPWKIIESSEGLFYYDLDGGVEILTTPKIGQYACVANVQENMQGYTCCQVEGAKKP